MIRCVCCQFTLNTFIQSPLICICVLFSFLVNVLIDGSCNLTSNKCMALTDLLSATLIGQLALVDLLLGVQQLAKIMANIVWER